MPEPVAGILPHAEPPMRGAGWRVLYDRCAYKWSWQELGSTGRDGEPRYDERIKEAAVANARSWCRARGLKLVARKEDSGVVMQAFLPSDAEAS